MAGYRRSVSANRNPHTNVLTVYAHSNPKPFCHALLEVFARRQMERGYARGKNSAETNPAGG